MTGQRNMKRVELGGEWYDFPIDHPLDANNPLLSMSLTKEDHTDYVLAPDPVRPELPDTLREYEALPSSQRRALEDKRTFYLSGLPTVDSLSLQKVHMAMKRNMLVNRGLEDGCRIMLVVDGAPGLGKTTMVRTFGRRLERTLRARHSERFTPPVGDYIPVVYLTMPAGATPNMMTRRFASYLGIPHRGKSSDHDVLTAAVVASLKQCGTRLVILDDIHFVKQTEKLGQQVNDHLKNIVSLVPATFVYAGVELDSSAFWSEGGESPKTQNSARSVSLKIEPFCTYLQAAAHASPRRPAEASDRAIVRAESEEWTRMISGFEDNLQLYRHRPGSLAKELPGYLLERTQGRISSLSLLLRSAAILAVEDGVECIDQEVLDIITTDEISQRAFTANSASEASA